MGDLSVHFNSSEFGGRPSRKLITRLERLRFMKGGKPLRIVSGIRTQAQNTAAGGATRSRHLVGEAADIEAGYATPREAARAGFTGIGISIDGAWAVHVDVRAGGRVAWRYVASSGWRYAPWPGPAG